MQGTLLGELHQSFQLLCVAVTQNEIDQCQLHERRLCLLKQTHELITDVDDQILEQPVTRDDVNALRAVETFGVHAGWVGDFWQTKPRFWFLWLATGHCHQHLGEAITVRSLLGIPWAP